MFLCLFFVPPDILLLGLSGCVAGLQSTCAADESAKYQNLHFVFSITFETDVDTNKLAVSAECTL